MQYRQDWIMRQIEMLVAFLAGALFHKDSARYAVRDEQHLSRGDLLHRRLRELLEAGEICRAEDLLFEEMDGRDSAYLEVAVDFYQRLNALDDEVLMRGNFSRGEVLQGLRDAMKRYRLEALWPET